MIASFVLLSLLSPPKSWTMVIGGDIMLNGVSAARSPFAGIERVVRAADVAYANLEIPLTNATTRTPNKSAAAIAARDQYVLKADPKHGAWIKQTGFDLLSLGNNHALDYGVAGLKQMRSLLGQLGIKHTGAGGHSVDAEKPVVFTTSSGVRVSMVSYLAFKSWGGLSACTPASDKRPGVAVLRFDGKIDWAAKQRIASIVNRARRVGDFVLVALHWGIEKQTIPTAYQVALGREFIAKGADIVIGAHPHVLQGAELFAGKPILYSMGNLVSPRGATTGLVRMTFTGRSLTKTEFLPAQISGGKVSLSKPSTTRFMALGSAIQRAYPDSHSRALTLR